MEDDCGQLNDEQRTALQKFVIEGDRGRADIFVGRKAELSVIRNRLKSLIERQNQHAPGADLTTVIQGAPGAGKSALMARIRDEWPLSGSSKGQPVAISLDPGMLKLPMPIFLNTIASKVRQIPEILRILRNFVSSMSVSVTDTVSVEIKDDSSKSSRKPPVPVIVLFDEIQTELTDNTSNQSREHLTKNLRLLHTGGHNAPLFPVYSGLANSADLLRIAGLTRLTSSSELTLSRFSDDEMDELIKRFFKQNLSSARPTQSTLNRCGAALNRDSQGWPMHCRNFLIRLSEEIQAKDWRPDMVDLSTVRASAQQLRFIYYSHRMQGALEDRYILVSKVLEAMQRGIPKMRGQIVELIEKAHQNSSPGAFGWSAVPEGLTAEQVFDVMLHVGIIQKLGNGKFVCPIPSLANYFAAKATFPPSPLHEAVLAASPEEISQAMKWCRDDEERGNLLQATDIRGRTPLVLAAELGMVSMVECLLQVESRLQTMQRTVEHRDNSGQTARDHATASGDERIVSLLDRDLGRSNPIN